MTSPYQKFCDRWEGCRGCALGFQRTKIVLARGKVPAEVLFVGEAPGPSEDVLGKPFVGPAGKLLDKIIEVGIDGRVDYCLTNLVACFPREAKGKGFNEPSEDEIESCGDRLREFTLLCKPKLVVCVGKLASRWAPTIIGTGGYISIIHPAAILRMDVSRKGLAIQRCIVAVSDAVDEIC